MCHNQTVIQSAPGPSNKPGAAFQRGNSQEKRTGPYSETLAAWSYQRPRQHLGLHGPSQGCRICWVIRPKGQGILFHRLDLPESLFTGHHSKLSQSVGQSLMPKYSIHCLQNQKRPTKHCASFFMVQGIKRSHLLLTLGELSKHAPGP